MKFAKRPSKFVKKSKKSSKKRPFKARLATIPRNRVSIGKGFPQQMIITHKYCQNDTLTNTAGSVDYQTYSCNSMYDPDVSGVGHQPLWYDNALLLYNHYTVIGSKITIRVAGLTTVSGGDHTPCLFVLQRHSSSIPTYTDPNTLQEQTYSKARINGPATGNVMTFTSKWSAKKTFGGSALSNANLQGSSGGAPAEQSYWTISNKPIDGVSNTGFQLNVTIEYIAVWRELRTIAQS